MRFSAREGGLAVVLAAALAGCRAPKDASGAIPRQRFVDANVAVRSVPDTVAGGDSLRHAALAKYHVTEADLKRFVNAHAGQPQYMADVWREIADSVQHRWQKTLPKGTPHVPPTPPVVAGGPPPVTKYRPPPAGMRAPGTPPPAGTPPPVRLTPPPPPPGPPQVHHAPLPMVKPLPRMKPPTEPPPDAQHGYNPPHPDTLRVPAKPDSGHR